MNDTKIYLEEVLGEQVEITPMSDNEIEKLPSALSQEYELYQAEILGVKVVMLKSINDDDFTPKQLYKVEERALKIFSDPIIFILSRIIPYNRRRLILHRINFIIPGTQMFIPTLLLDLGRMVAAKHPKLKTLTPLAQQITLYHLQINSLNGKTSKELLELLPAKYITMTRALNYLSELNILTLSHEKERKITFITSGEELWKMVEPLMSSPIKRVLHCCDELAEKLSVTSYTNALAAYYSQEQKEEMHYAIFSDDVEKLTSILDKENGDNRVEIWKYCPIPLSQNGIVDRLSLYLILRDSEKEKIRLRATALLDDIRWA